MKRWLVTTAAIALFTLSACGKNDTPDPLNTPRTDALTLEADYEGKSYLEDGIGIAVFASCEDGDTAEFIVDGQQIRVRFLGIDTPEASHYYEPWGYQATQFVCARLEAAEIIVLEHDESRTLKDTYGRYLAFIWYDGRLINLEVIEQAYSHAIGVLDMKYGQDMWDAWVDAQDTNRRIHGETDALFDYSTEGTDVSIETIVTDWEPLNFKVVNVEGVVTAMVGIHAYIQQDGYGIFLYIGHSSHSNLVIGNRIRLDNVRVIYDLERRGGVHLTDFAHSRSTVTVLETGVEIEPLTLDIALLATPYHGRLITLTNLTIQSIEEHLDGSLTMLAEDANGDTVIILQSHHTFDPNKINPGQFTPGDTVSITGPLRDSSDGWQILLTHPDRITLLD